MTPSSRSAGTQPINHGQPAPHQEDAEHGHGNASGRAQAVQHYRAAVRNNAVRPAPH